MSWQEELRKLDEELAAGRLSADDYRVRRDQVLSSAVTQGEPGGNQQAPTEQPSGAPGSNADSTQVISPVQPQANSGQSSSEATQFVANPGHQQHQAQQTPAWQAQPPQPQQPGPQQTPPQQGQYGHPGSPAGGFSQPAQPGQPWNTPEQDMSPPWGGTDLPPADPGSQDWVRQGPEFFTEEKGKGGKIAVIVLVSVLVVGGLVTGGIFLFSGGDSNQPAAEQTSEQNAPQTPTSTAPPSPNQQLFDKMPKPPGQADTNNGVLPVGELAQLDILSTEEMELLTTESVTEVAWRGSQKQPDDTGPTADVFSVMVIPTESQESATNLAEKLREYAKDNSFVRIEEPLPDMPKEVVFQKETFSGVGHYRGTWISGDNLIRVNVVQDPLTDEASLSGSYQRAVKTMLESFPADG
ncbi:DUF1707 domain-containing protein [Amycolatopsis aidingensis]|uniref:hypothetical protein n=1 Tax=Amycolatopsis aidingensis TaxID=2842453 RepID=UPI001E31C43F|nr:hypothetical protein [Amycolatopsis aidingensis]